MAHRKFVDLPIEDGDFPVRYVSLPESLPEAKLIFQGNPIQNVHRKNGEANGMEWGIFPDKPTNEQDKWGGRLQFSCGGFSAIILGQLPLNPQ